MGGNIYCYCPFVRTPYWRSLIGGDTIEESPRRELSARRLLLVANGLQELAYQDKRANQQHGKCDSQPVEILVDKALDRCAELPNQTCDKEESQTSRHDRRHDEHRQVDAEQTARNGK